MPVLIAFLIAVIAVCAGCFVIAAWADRAPHPQPEPRHNFDTVELCHVNGCPREYQHDTAGWRECHLHYYERIGQSA